MKIEKYSGTVIFECSFWPMLSIILTYPSNDDGEPITDYMIRASVVRGDVLVGIQLTYNGIAVTYD